MIEVRDSCRRAGRDPGEVTLVAVSKTRSGAEIDAAFAAGQRHFGENRVQEARDKFADAKPPGLVLHLVGHLQKNKARPAAALFDAVHSADDAELLRLLDRHATRPVDVFLEVDLAREPTKSGALPEALPAILALRPELARVRIVGLMCIPPFLDDPERVRPYFRRLREIRDALAGAPALPSLSMGMSHDFEVAIAEGATHVRIGAAIFGPRP